MQTSIENNTANAINYNGKIAKSPVKISNNGTFKLTEPLILLNRME
jgi:hypothetical protein